MTTNHFHASGDDSTARFAPGQKVLNRYTLQRVLGQGGMGVVWLARDEELDMEVALKFLPSLVVNDRASLNDLRRETRRSLSLTHPHIVRTYDFLQDGSIAGISMEYVDADTLRNRRIDQPSGVFQTADLGEWTTQLSDALEYAHKTASIVHRDLKPANLLVNGRNHLKIADFGIARSLIESVTQVTGGNTSSGTLLYMSPQQIEGDPTHPLDDIYALGATLYELCTSRPPFFSGDISRQIHLKVPPSMTDRRSELGIPQGEIPKNWETTVASCLAKDAAQRPQSAREVATRLGLHGAASITSLVAPPPAAIPVAPGFQRTPAGTTPLPVAVPMHFPAGHGAGTPATRRNLVIAASAAAVVILGLGAYWLFGSRTADKPASMRAAATPKAAENTPSTPAPTAAVVQQSAKPAPAVKPTPGRALASQTTAAVLDQSVEPTVQPTPAVPTLAGPTEEERLANARGSIFVQSELNGTRMKVDDLPVEKTPFLQKDLTLGKHSVRVFLDGYEDYTAQVEVKENQTTDLGKFKLTRSTGWLKVTTSPPGLDVVIVNAPDASLLKATHPDPWDSDKLPIGDYELSVTRPGWEPVKKKVSLAREQLLPVAFDLSGGSVRIESVPPKAAVLADGQRVGTTPCTLEGVQPGDVKYSVVIEGYGKLDLAGKLEPGQTLPLNAKLVKIAVVKPRSSNATASARSSGSRHSDDDDDDDDNKKRGHRRSGDTLDKANRAADLANKVRGFPMPFRPF